MRNVVGWTLLSALGMAVSCSLIGDFSHLTVVENGGSGPGGSSASSGTGAGGGSGGGGGTGGCQPTGPEICDNNADDDCDGDVDCDDSECTNITCAYLGVTCGTAVAPCGGATLLCDNQQEDGDETDVDCGGDPVTCETRCADGLVCAEGADCVSQVCEVTCQPPACGDGVINGDEECEDGTVAASYDGCSADCLHEASHLLISEVVDDDDAAEFIEIYNPTNGAISLADVYLSNLDTYYEVTIPMTAEILIQFPPTATIAAYGFVVVSLESATLFEGKYGAYPDFDLEPNDANAPAMLGDAVLGSKIDNEKAMIVLFRWDGQTDLVDDLDYFLYGTDTSEAMDKTGEQVGSSTYQPETPPANQIAVQSPGKNKALYRCDTAETTETLTGGNGVSGHDETSEDMSYAFRQVDAPTPGMAPADTGPCP